MLKPAKVDKAFVLGDAMALIEVISEIGNYYLGHIYVPPEKNDKSTPLYK